MSPRHPDAHTPLATASRSARDAPLREEQRGQWHPACGDGFNWGEGGGRGNSTFIGRPRRARLRAHHARLELAAASTGEHLRRPVRRCGGSAPRPAAVQSNRCQNALCSHVHPTAIDCLQRARRGAGPTRAVGVRLLRARLAAAPRGPGCGLRRCARRGPRPGPGATSAPACVRGEARREDATVHASSPVRAAALVRCGPAPRSLAGSPRLRTRRTLPRPPFF